MDAQINDAHGENNRLEENSPIADFRYSLAIPAKDIPFDSGSEYDD
jgi:hypothetical protein